LEEFAKKTCGQKRDFLWDLYSAIFPSTLLLLFVTMRAFFHLFAYHSQIRTEKVEISVCIGLRQRLLLRT
jgi:hypothetical protein